MAPPITPQGTPSPASGGGRSGPDTEDAGGCGGDCVLALLADGSLHLFPGPHVTASHVLASFPDCDLVLPHHNHDLESQSQEQCPAVMDELRTDVTYRILPRRTFKYDKTLMMSAEISIGAGRQCTPPARKSSSPLTGPRGSLTCSCNDSKASMQPAYSHNNQQQSRRLSGAASWNFDGSTPFSTTSGTPPATGRRQRALCRAASQGVESSSGPWEGGPGMQGHPPVFYFRSVPIAPSRRRSLTYRSGPGSPLFTASPDCSSMGPQGGGALGLMSPAPAHVQAAHMRSSLISPPGALLGAEYADQTAARIHQEGEGSGFATFHGSPVLGLHARTETPARYRRSRSSIAMERPSQTRNPVLAEVVALERGAEWAQFVQQVAVGASHECSGLDSTGLKDNGSPYTPQEDSATLRGIRAFLQQLPRLQRRRAQITSTKNILAEAGVSSM